MINDLQVINYFLRPHKNKVFMIFILLIISALLETINVGLFYPFVNSIIIGTEDNLQNGGTILESFNSLINLVPINDKIVASGVLLLVVLIISNFFGFFSEGITTWYRYKLMAKYMNITFEKICNKNYSYFVEKKQGELLYLGMNASKAVGEMLLFFPKIANEFFRVLFIIILLLTVSVKLTSFLLIATVLFGLIIYTLSVKIIHPIAVKLQEAQASVNTVFAESISGIKSIKIFDKINYWLYKFSLSTDADRKLSTQRVCLGYIPSRIVLIVGGMSIVLTVIYLKIYYPENFTVLLPILSVFVLSIIKIMPSFNNIGRYWMDLKGLAPRLKLVYQTLNDSEKTKKEGEVKYKGLENEIKFHNIFFNYNNNNDVLKNINILIKKGSSVAIVGESGSGKSTLADIFARLYVPTKGEILIDGINYLNFQLSDWLSTLGVVSQDTFIFNLSIKENIKMAKLSANDDEIISAAKIANAHDYIMKLNKEYDTVVGDRGVKLSGGQKQRIAIARAVISNPDVLILDEATSSLDNLSELKVQKAINKARKNRTTIIIAHRLSTIENVDKIYFMKNGKIIEEGNHDELIQLKGDYFRMYNKQIVNKDYVK